MLCGFLISLANIENFEGPLNSSFQRKVFCGDTRSSSILASQKILSRALGYRIVLQNITTATAYFIFASNPKVKRKNLIFSTLKGLGSHLQSHQLLLQHGLLCKTVLPNRLRGGVKKMRVCCKGQSECIEDSTCHCKENLEKYEVLIYV